MDPNLATDTSTQNPKLARIRIFPFKSLPGIDVPTTGLTTKGALNLDRRFAFHFTNGGFFNAKRDARIHLIRFQMLQKLETTRFQFSIHERPDSMISVVPEEGFQKLERWVHQHFQIDVTVSTAPDSGFPDDTQYPGPTLISTATLTAISEWFSDLTVEEVRNRFRTNLEISGVPAFWEDRLLPSSEGIDLPFQIGSTTFVGKNPCQRCVVPTRNSQTGTITPDFINVFRKRREALISQRVNRKLFNHYYRAAINTIVPTQESTEISVGDPILTEGA